MRKCIPILVLVLAACDLSTDPEVRRSAQSFPVRAQWTATATPVGTGTVRGTFRITEHEGSQMDAQASISGGAATRAYQWRVFRGSCAVTDAASLALFSTIQAYPDLTTDGSGNAAVSTFLAGALRDDTEYSVRVRLAPTTTNWNGTSPAACGDLRKS